MWGSLFSQLNEIMNRINGFSIFLWVFAGFGMAQAIAWHQWSLFIAASVIGATFEFGRRCQGDNN